MTPVWSALGSLAGLDHIQTFDINELESKDNSKLLF